MNKLNKKVRIYSIKNFYSFSAKIYRQIIEDELIFTENCDSTFLHIDENLQPIEAKFYKTLNFLSDLNFVSKTPDFIKATVYKNLLYMQNWNKNVSGIYYLKTDPKVNLIQIENRPGEIIEYYPEPNELLIFVDNLYHRHCCFKESKYDAITFEFDATKRNPQNEKISL